jgi:ribonuclease PH
VQGVIPTQRKNTHLPDEPFIVQLRAAHKNNCPTIQGNKPMPRPHGRKHDELRSLTFKRRYTRQAPGSVLVKLGRTTVLCTCCVEQSVPPFLVGKGQGWLSAEYGMLPGSTSSRKPRDKGGKVDGRTVEIQRLIGRSLRAIVDLSKLGERTLWLDCDVIEADGGTRTASINGAFVALVDALTTLEGAIGPASNVVKDSIAAISVGLLEDVELLDLEYVEDKDAEVDMNLVMTGAGQFVEVQGTGEEATFSRSQLDRLLKLGKVGIDAVTKKQREALGAAWPWR